MGKTGAGKKNAEIAVFACGCFWSKEYFFGQAEGVISTRVGYTGGHKDFPTYKEVCAKTTGHAEAVEITFDPDRTSFEALARLFFELHDPTVDRRDNGGQYRSAIFCQNEGQKAVAQQLLEELQRNGPEAFTQLEPASTFWQAEARHQKYCDTHGMAPRRPAYRLKR